MTKQKYNIAVSANLNYLFLVFVLFEVPEDKGSEREYEKGA